MSTPSPGTLSQEARMAAEQADALLHYAVEASGRLLEAARGLERADANASSLSAALRAVGAAEDLLTRARSRLGAVSDALTERCHNLGDASRPA